MLFTTADIAEEMNKEKLTCIKKLYTAKEVAHALNDLQLPPFKMKQRVQGWRTPPVSCFTVRQVALIKKRVKIRRIFKNNMRIRFTKEYMTDDV